MSLPSSPEPTDPSLARVAFKAKLLLWAFVLLLAGATLYLMYARGVFESTQRLVLVADDSEGVSPGMELTYAGFVIGRVQSIAIANDGMVHILIDIPRKQSRWLRTSSVFTMEKSLLGSIKLRAFTGVLTDPPLSDGAQRAVLKGDAMAQLPQMITAAQDLLRNLNQLTSAESDLAATMNALKELSAGLAGHKTVGRKSPIVKSVQDTQALLKQLQGLIKNADRQLFETTQSVVPEVQNVLQDLRKSLQKVDGLLVDAQGIAGNTRAATEDLHDLRMQVDATLNTVNGMVLQLQQKWPFNPQPQLSLP